MKKIGILLLLGIIYCQILSAQDPARFKKEIDSLKQLTVERKPYTKLILFTGSSSIRMWNNIQDYFPDKTVINTGFGGSHMSDLLYYLDEIVIKYRPDQIFIYEGDNDVASGKKPAGIMKDTRKLIHQLNKALPFVQTVLISPKPSLARWELRETYTKLNNRFEKYAARNGKIDFINVWPVMLNEEGTPVKELFIEDGLHMSKAGYDLWVNEIKKYMK
jgi:lysophospholipase L1-like esterase